MQCVQRLSENGHRLATVSVETCVADALSRVIVARSTSTACASLGTTMSLQRIVTGWALFQRAVGATEASVTLATLGARRIPCRIVLGTCVLGTDAVIAVFVAVWNGKEVSCGTIVSIVGKVIGNLGKRLARSVSVASVGADGALASGTSVSLLASAVTT